MTIVLIILVLFIAALGVALYFQMKGAKEQAEEGQQLLKDYQKRVNELEKLLKDYSDLQKNFDSVGEGYEQALLQFDKMEEERQTMANVKEKLEKQVSDIMAAKSTLEQAVVQKKDLIQKAWVLTQPSRPKTTARPATSPPRPSARRASTRSTT